MVYGNDISTFDLNDKQVGPTSVSSDLHRTDWSQPGDLDIPRLRKGHLGGFFWSMWVLAPSSVLALC